MWSSDYWDFPTNKLPTSAGWGASIAARRGRRFISRASDVHVHGLTWMDWTGNLNPFDAANDAPVQDRLLFDVFTTAFNDNATRGTLSVNVGAAPGGQSRRVVGAVQRPRRAHESRRRLHRHQSGRRGRGQRCADDQLRRCGKCAAGINDARASYINPDGLAGVFEHQGDILRAPQLTEQSPYLNGLNPTNQISDEMYEWLPQQIMSLLRVGTPRYVIYSYGQALKPAPKRG